jgi:hypothetical protein
MNDITLEQKITRLTEYYDMNDILRMISYGKSKGYDTAEFFGYLHAQVTIDWQLLESYNRELPLFATYVIGYKSWKEEGKQYGR